LVFIGDIYFAKSRQNWFQEFVFVLDDDEKTRGVAEELDAAAESRLCVDSEFVGVVHDDALEKVVFVALYVGLGKLFEFVSNEFDTLAVGAVDKHDVIFDSVAIELVDAVDKVADDSSLTRSSRSVKYDVGDFSDVDKIIEFRFHLGIFGELENRCGRHYREFKRICFYVPSVFPSLIFEFRSA